MNGRQPHEVAELDQGYAELRDMVADLISKAREHLTEGELPAFAGATRALFELDISREFLCGLAAGALIYAAAQPPTRPAGRCAVSEAIIRVTARDMERGEEDVVDLRPGQFVVTCAEPLYVAHEQRHINGTIVLTLKRRPGNMP